MCEVTPIAPLNITMVNLDVDLDVLCRLPLNQIFVELQSALVVTPNDDQSMKPNAQLNEKVL